MSRSTIALLLCISGFLGKAVACPNLCDCSKSGWVRCGSRVPGLTSFPLLKDIPPNTTFMDLSFNQIRDVPAGVFAQLKELKSLKLSNNRIERIPRFAAYGGSNLQILTLDNNDIRNIESGALDDLDKLFELNLIGNKLETFPNFTTNSSLKNLYLNSNPGLTSLSKPSLENLPELLDLEMEKTNVRELPDYIFSKNNKLVSLTFKNSLLETVGKEAFVGADGLQTLILDNTNITSLSSRGLRNLRRLSLSGVKNFWKIERGFASIREVDVSDYNSYLCCAFYLKLYKRDYGKLDSSVGNEYSTQLSTTISTFFSRIFTSSTSLPTPAVSTTVSRSPTTASKSVNQTMNTTTVAPIITTTDSGPWGKRRRRDLPKTTDSGWFPGDGGFVPGTTTSSNETPISTKSNHGFTIPGFIPGTVSVPTRIPHGNKTNESLHTAPPPEDVVCRPESDAFHPCEDLMGASWLTILCFMVGSVALVANLVVMVVIILSEKRFNVTKFLMCNLACADFCLGLYLFVLVCVSLTTSGQYYNHVRSWQYGAGCKVAGFLAVFSTELSVYTLALITVERFMAIAYAMQRNLRLSLRKASKAMVFGWLFALLMASLPLVGVNSYEKVAICLPFDIDSPGALVYVSALLLINGGVFLTVAGMYVKMFLVVAVGPGHMDGGAPQRNDAKVAKRMALLVATDFVCWAPIAIFGLMAAFGQQAIDVTHSKILLVFFFPLNSLCNPFLYAFVTKAFKREFYSLLSKFGFCKTRALRYKGTFSSLMYSRSRAKRSTTVDEDAERKSKRSISASYSETRMSGLSFSGDVSSIPYPLVQDEHISMTAFSNPGFGISSQSKDDVFFQSSSTTSSSGAKSNVSGNQGLADGHVQSSLLGSVLDSPAFSGKKATSEGKKVSVSFKEQDEFVTPM